MLQAWAEAHGVVLAPGTLNVCAETPPVLSGRGATLRDHAHLVQPAWRARQAGFDPRLYAVTLNGRPAWLFRWADEDHLRTFVGDTAQCAAERHCEIVATEHLRTALGLQDGHVVELEIR